MKKIKVVIAGAGHAGIHLHLPAYRNNPHVDIVALVDLNAESLDRQCREHGIPRFHTDIVAALENEKPDLVSITTPPATHFALTKSVLEAGSSVLVEKPIFQSVDEARQIMQLEDRLPGAVIPVHNKLGFPGTIKAMDFFRHGLIGEVVHVNAYWMTIGTENHMTINAGHWSHRLPGGRWQELIPHPIYLAYQFLGKLEYKSLEVLRTGKCLPHLIADEVTILLEGEKGWLNIRLSANTRTYNYLEVFGTLNSVKITSHDAVLSRVDKGNREAVEALTMAHPKIVPANEAVTGDLRHAPYIDEVVKFLMNERDKPVSWEEAINVLELNETIGNAIKEKCSVL